MDIEARIARLEAESEIRGLIARYGFTIDDRDLPAIAALFTDDARVASEDGVMEARGIDAGGEVRVITGVLLGSSGPGPSIDAGTRAHGHTGTWGTRSGRQAYGCVRTCATRGTRSVVRWGGKPAVRHARGRPYGRGPGASRGGCPGVPAVVS